MKLSSAYKTLFKNYRIILILLILGYVYQFTQLRWRTFPQAIQNIINIWNLSSTLSELMANLPPLVYQIAASLILWLCVYSGIIYLCKRIICNEPANMGDFVLGVEKNLKIVFIALILFTISFGLIINILQNLIALLPIEGSLITAAKSTLNVMLTLFYNALVIYASIFLIENGMKLCYLFKSTIKFIFSKKSLKLFIVLLIAGLLLQPVYTLKADYYNSLISSRGLGGFLDIVLPTEVPIWIKALEWLIDTVVKAFTAVYISSLFYDRSETSDTIGTADTYNTTDTSDSGAETDSL